MKPEIKFRLWDPKNKQMISWEHLELWLDGVRAIDEEGTMFHFGYETLMQDTGLGAYEGDIIEVYDNNRYCICNEWEDCSGEGDSTHKNHGEHKHENRNDCEKYVCTQEVKWTQGGYFCDEDTGDFCPPLGADEIEIKVIGNIYENHELLASRE